MFWLGSKHRLTAVVLFFVCFLFCLFVCLFCCFPLVLFHLAFFFFFWSPTVLLNHTAETLRVSVHLVSAWQKLSWIDYIWFDKKRVFFFTSVSVFRYFVSVVKQHYFSNCLLARNVPYFLPIRFLSLASLSTQQLNIYIYSFKQFVVMNWFVCDKREYLKLQTSDYRPQYLEIQIQHNDRHFVKTFLLHIMTCSCVANNHVQIFCMSGSFSGVSV